VLCAFRVCLFFFLVMNKLLAFAAVASLSSLSRVGFNAAQSSARLSSSTVDKLPSQKRQTGNVSESALCRSYFV